MEGPDSSYSALEIHICWKVLKEAKMEPPIHTEYLRSGGATTLIFMVEGARAVSSLVMRSAMPGNIVVPNEEGGRKERKERNEGMREGGGVKVLKEWVLCSERMDEGIKRVDN